MKNLFMIFTSLFLIGIIYLTIKGNKMQEIKTEIEIDAPPSKVWSILMDIDKWQEWSPIINASQGKASLGTQLSITMMGENKGQDGPKYNPKIIELKESKYFRWSATMLAGFIFTNDKIFELEETKTGTKLIHIETFKGLLAPLFSSKMEKGVPVMLNSMNKALKQLAEK